MIVIILTVIIVIIVCIIIIAIVVIVVTSCTTSCIISCIMPGGYNCSMPTLPGNQHRDAAMLGHDSPNTAVAS